MISNQQFSIDQVNMAQQSIQTTIDTVGAMKIAHASQKEQMKKIDIN